MVMDACKSDFFYNIQVFNKYSYLLLVINQ
jgi:hypothetical protein